MSDEAPKASKNYVEREQPPYSETLFPEYIGDLVLTESNYSATTDSTPNSTAAKSKSGMNRYLHFLQDKLTICPAGKYSVTTTVGRGGMKSVLGIKDKDTCRNLAMATISNISDTSDSDIEGFIREARITANLEHPNIVPVHDIGIDSLGMPYFTMRFLEGETLADVIEALRKNDVAYTKCYNLSHLLQIFLKVCNAISFAHSKGIAHLDLKPSNIQVGEFGDVLVLDWGLAKYVSENKDEVSEDNGRAVLEEISVDYDHTLKGVVRGTPGYMAPEQAAGQNHTKDQLTDIYSIGALLYNILTYRKPISGPSVYDIVEDTIDGKFVPPSKRCPDFNIPKALEAITLKAMSVDRSDRYQTVKEVIADIDAFVSGFATVAERAGYFRLMTLFIKRNKSVTLLISLVTLLIVSSTSFWVINELKYYAAWGSAESITPTDESFQNDWHVQSGRWKFESDKLIAAEGKGDSFRIFYNRSVYGNIAIEFEAMVSKEEFLKKSGDLSVILCGDKSKKNGYYLQLGGLGNRSAVIQKNGTVLSSRPFTLQAGRTYHIRAEKEGENLRIFCDGELILKARDIFYREGGKVGLYTFGEGKEFSNIRLYSKGVPELVSPLQEGDGFYRASRARTGKNRIEFLHLAHESYSRVLESYPNKGIGHKALIKRCYVDLELGKIEEVKNGLEMIRGEERSLEFDLLSAEYAFTVKDYRQAYAFYVDCFSFYKNEREAFTGMLMSKLSDKNVLGTMENEILGRFWTLYAANQTNPVLRCSNSFLNSLDFVKGLSFEMIDCSQNFLTSLTPLAGMPLKHLDCADNNIDTLEPIRGMQLEVLECFNNPQITSLEPLVGMPLRELAFNGCEGINDVTALTEIPTLERIILSKSVKNIEILKRLPNLKFISFDWEERDTPAYEFWRKYKNTRFR